MLLGGSVSETTPVNDETSDDRDCGQNVQCERQAPEAESEVGDVGFRYTENGGWNALAKK